MTGNSLHPFPGGTPPASAPFLPADGRTFPRPPAPPAALATDTTSLDSLVHHRWSVPHDTPFEAVHRLFGERNVDFMALVRDERVTGLCSRGHLGFMLGSRYGFALFSRSPAHLAQVARPLVFTFTTPVREVLEGALSRRGDEFREDVILVDDNHHLLGLIPTEALAHLQNRLVAEQLGELRRQHELVRRQNLDLFGANHALRQAQALHRGLFESNPLGVVLLDSRGMVQTHNRRFAELLNLGEVPAGGLPLVSLVAERERPLFLSLLPADGRQTPASAIQDFTLCVAGKGLRIFRMNTRWVGETSQICACFEDITDQRATERNLRRREKQMLLDTLVGGIAHELNNKLSPVLGFAELLESVPDERSRTHAGYIKKSAIEAAHIIRQLLQLSRPESGRTQTADLRQVVEESLVMLKFQIRETNTEVCTALPPDPVNVLADAAQLKQVFINLAINALQAMSVTPQPRLEIAVDRHENTAVLSVKDNGTGIASEIMSRIFDPFFTTKGPDKGSGLGLSICSSIVHKYGGDITVESEPGSGTCFTVNLPFTETAVDAPAAAPKSRSNVRPGGLTDRRVLVVEDEDVVRKLLQEVICSNFGCRVDSASNGCDGLSLAAHENYDLIVSDVRMPEMNGVELYWRLRELHPPLAGRFLFVSGHAGDEQLEKEIRRCNVPLVAKPFTMADFAGACLPFLSGARPLALSPQPS